MKGPGLRIDLDVRRIWRCAACGRVTRTGGHVVAQRCGCSDGSQLMALQPPVKCQPFLPPQREPLPEEEEILAPFPVAPLDPAKLPEVVPPAAAAQPDLDPIALATDAVSAPPPAAADEPAPTVPGTDEFGAGIDDDATAEPKA